MSLYKSVPRKESPFNKAAFNTFQERIIKIGQIYCKDDTVGMMIEYVVFQTPLKLSLEDLSFQIKRMITSVDNNLVFIVIIFSCIYSEENSQIIAQFVPQLNTLSLLGSDSIKSVAIQTIGRLLSYEQIELDQIQWEKIIVNSRNKNTLLLAIKMLQEGLNSNFNGSKKVIELCLQIISANPHDSVIAQEAILALEYGLLALQVFDEEADKTICTLTAIIDQNKMLAPSIFRLVYSVLNHFHVRPCVEIVNKAIELFPTFEVFNKNAFYLIQYGIEDSMIADLIPYVMKHFEEVDYQTKQALMKMILYFFSIKKTNDNIYAELLKYLIDEDALESFGNKKWFVQTVEEIVEHFENGFDSEFLSAEEYEIAKDFISTYKI
ncbi:MAG: hypothetical protein SO206_03705 [Bacilli bacterium]|nr:hypothetical protein [Bacilli bacterium]